MFITQMEKWCIIYKPNKNSLISKFGYASIYGTRFLSFRNGKWLISHWAKVMEPFKDMQVKPKFSLKPIVERNLNEYLSCCSSFRSKNGWVNRWNMALFVSRPLLSGNMWIWIQKAWFDSRLRYPSSHK